MASKRSIRAYVEEDDGADDNPVRQGKWSAACEEFPSVGMERQGSTSSSSQTSCDGSVGASIVGAATVDLGRDLTDLLQPRSWALPRDELLKTLSHQETPIEVSTAVIRSSIISTARPPVNFGIVVPGVYRSSYPATEDYAFIRDLKLKSIVTLVDKEYPDGYQAFMAGHGIHHRVFSMRGTKKEAIPLSVMRSILRHVLDRQNHPLLIHCNHGKHRTGCVVAVVRKLSGWTLADVISEYQTYAHPKARECDVEYITSFQPSNLSKLFRDTTALGFRVPNFFRTTFFTIFVLVLWMISGSQMVYPLDHTAQNSEDSSD